MCLIVVVLAKEREGFAVFLAAIGPCVLGFCVFWQGSL